MVPKSRYNETILPRFMLHILGWAEACDGKHVLSFHHLHQASVDRVKRLVKTEHLDPTSITSEEADPHIIPACIRSSLEEQNSLETELYRWAESRFDRALQKFRDMGPEVTCEERT